MRNLLIALMFMMLVFQTVPPAQAAEAVVFDDPVLEALIRGSLKIPDREVTARDMEKLSKIETNRDWERDPDPAAQIFSLAALAHAKNLKTIALQFHRITDISPLAGLKKLSVLQLGGNPVAKVDALSGLSGLTSLSLFNCEAADYSPLAKLKKLKQLELHFSSFDDLTLLSGLVHLESLGLIRCQAADYSPLAKLKKLKELDLRESSIKDLTPLQGLTKLQRLDLSYTGVQDLSPLAKLAALRALKLSGCAILDFTPIEKIYPKLKEKDFEPVVREAVVFDDAVLERAIRKALGIEAGAVYVSDMAALSDIGTGLDYEQNPAPGSRVKSIQALRHCVNLERIDLNFNEITDISPLAGLMKLRDVWLGGNPIKDITPLSGHTGIELLALFNCEAGDYAPLATLVNLKELYLDYADIGDLTPLSSLRHLERLSLVQTKVSDVAPLQNLTSLVSLQLSRNDIADYSPLKALSKGLLERDFDPDETNEPIQFVDPVAEKYIRKALQRPEGVITTAMARGLTGLGMDYNWEFKEEIHSLKDLEHFTNLELFVMQYQPVTDLSPLAGLTKLTVLDLKGCRATDYSPLANLKTLKTLELEDADISDIRFLSEFENLEQLNLYNTLVSDVSPLAGLTRLGKLRLGSTQVKDFSPVAHILPTLTDQDPINIVGEGMVQFTDANLEQRILKEMGKTEGGVTLLEAAALKSLDLSRDPFSPNDQGTIRSLSGLERFTGLEFLDLGGNRILRRLGPISALTGLTTLHFCWCDVTDITPLKELTELKELVFGWGNRVETLDALSGLLKLEAIDAKTAGIRDASGLADLPKLFEVQLCDNQITDVTPFTRLPSLSVLLLANNPITDLSPLDAILPTIETDLK